MRKGFTLLELIVVIIILGILATLGMQQYFRVVEKSRSAEAKQVLGQLRESAAARYTESNDISAMLSPDFGIGATTNLIPSACRSSNYFSYAAVGTAASTFLGTATRCVGANGKQPGYSVAATVTLTSNLGVAALDTWAYHPAYL